MKSVRILLVGCLVFVGLTAVGQGFHYLENPTEHSFKSKAMGKSMEYSVYMPKNFNVTDSVKFPVVFVFDRQNERACGSNVQAIDYLMSNFVIPSFIVVAIDQDQRFYETSIDLGRDGSGGIEPFLEFVLHELDSLLVADYQANDFRMLIGHSRTAFMTTYALAKYPNEVHAVIANSPFFTEPSSNPKIDLISELENAEFEGERFYSFSYGGNGRDAHYEYCTVGEKRFETAKLSNKLNWTAAMYPNADHFTVVGHHTLGALSEWGADYSKILSAFLNDETKEGMGVEWLKAELDKVSETYGMDVPPELVHINSITSHYWQLKDFEQVIAFLKYGLESYPKDLDLHSFLAYAYEETGDKSKAIEHYEQALKYVGISCWYSDQEKQELKQQLNTAIGELKK